MIGSSNGLEDACRRAQDMIDGVSECWRRLPLSSACPGGSPVDEGLMPCPKKEYPSQRSVRSKLARLYFEELSKIPDATPDTVLHNLENECDLLGRLVRRERLHTLVVNLYAGNKGYSLGVRSGDKGNQFEKCTLAETQPMGYEQGELLSCIDNGQLPAMLAEQLENDHSHLFYDGCIIAEVRDYRKAFPRDKAEVHHVLLKPTTQSLLSDVSSLTNDGDWSHEERLMLESRLIAATQGPLCLDPSPVPGLAATRLRRSKSLITDHRLVRRAKKFSQVTLNRKRKLEQLARPADGLTIRDMMQKLRTKRGVTTTGTTCPAPSLANPPLLPPTTPIDVLRFAKAYERPRETKDCLPQLIEEYILETERSQGRVYHIKLSILQRPSNSEYLGELYVDRDHREGERNGSACRFALGTRAQANHYIQQFTEIFTEEGRKNVRIKHVVPGQPPRVTCTPGMQRAHQQAQQAHAAQLVAQQLQQQVQSQRVAQQILSRAQGQLSTLAGQVATIKSMTESGSSARSNLTSHDSGNVSRIVTHGADTSALNSAQTLTNGAAAAAAAATGEGGGGGSGGSSGGGGGGGGTPSTEGSDASVCNNSGILVFQQKPSADATVTDSAPTNVPVLQAQLQAGTHGSAGESTAQTSTEASFKKHTTNPAISALVTSLMNSAQQFQQQAAANAAAAAAAAAMNSGAQTTPKSNNAAILSLLNSSPANLSQRKNQPRRISLNASIPPRVIGHGNVITVPSQGSAGQVRVSFSSALTGQLTGKQQPVKATAVRLARVQDSTSTLGLSMPGLSALLAGTPSADNPIPGINSASSLLERLTASSSNQASQPSSPMTSPPPPPATNVNLQGVNLTSLPSSINGLQNVQVSFPGLSQPITMSLNVSAATGSVTPTGVIVSLPISSGTDTCTTVSSMVAATVVTTAIAGSSPTVVIANPANTHLSLPIAQIIPSGVKGLSQQSVRSTGTIALPQGAQAIQLVGSQRPRANQVARQAQQNPIKPTTVLPNQLVTVAKTVTASQLILSGSKQVLTPIMAATKPVLMATQTTPSSQVMPANKQTLLAKSFNARATSTAGQCGPQSQGIVNVTTLSQQQLQRTLVKPVQLQQLQHCLAAQHKATTPTDSSANRSQMQPQRNATPAPGEETL